MAGLLEIKSVKNETDTLLDQELEVLDVLSKYKVNVKEYSERLEAITEKWNEIKTQTPAAKDSVGPIQVCNQPTCMHHS
jgi:hypothetical protein